MKELPADLADVLHLLNPLLWVLAFLLLFLLLLLALFLLWWRRRRRKPATTPPPSPRPVPSTGAGRFGIVDVIRDIRERHERSRDYRQGCHELSTTLRSHFETKKGRRFGALTAKEIVGKLGASSLSTLFELLADLQFSREEPTGNDFRDVCDMAAEEVSRKRS